MTPEHQKVIDEMRESMFFAADWINAQPEFVTLARLLKTGAFENILCTMGGEYWVLTQREKGLNYQLPQIPPHIKIAGPQIPPYKGYEIRCGAEWILRDGKWLPLGKDGMEMDQ